MIEFFKPIPKVQYVMYLSQPKYGTLSEEYYLIKLRHQFNEENLYSVFSISMRNHNSKNIDTILLIAQKNKFPQEKLLPYIMLYGTQYQWTKDMIVILNSIKPQNKYAKKIFFNNYCTYYMFFNDITLDNNFEKTGNKKLLFDVYQKLSGDNIICLHKTITDTGEVDPFLQNMFVIK